MVPIPQKNPQSSPLPDFNAKIISNTVKPNHFVDLLINMTRNSGLGGSMVSGPPVRSHGADSHAANGHPPKPSQPYRRATAYTAQYTPSPHLVAKARHDDGLDEPTEKKSREERQRERMSIKEAQGKDEALLAMQRQMNLKWQGFREDAGESVTRRASDHAQEGRQRHAEEERHATVRGEFDNLVIHGFFVVFSVSCSPRNYELAPRMEACENGTA
jgi:hypothetical protein